MSGLLVVHSSNELYGADRMLLRAIDALRSSVEITVLLPDDVESAPHSLDAELQARGVRVRTAPLPIIRRANLTPRGLLSLLRRSISLYREIRRDKPAALWCGTSACLPLATVARLCGVRTVVLHNQEVWRRSERFALGILARPCTAVVAISRASANSLSSAIRSRATVIENATERPEQIATPPGGTRSTFLMASRWNSWKGHRTLLEAWKLADEPGMLLITGGPPSAGLAVDVPAIVAELGLTRTVQVLGETENISPLLRQTNYAIVPSDAPEPFGLVAIEAMANARPVIGSSAGGLGDVITDGVDGFLFTNNSVDELASILRRATPALSAQMSHAAVATFDSRYSIEAFEVRLKAFWARLAHTSNTQQIGARGA